MPGVDFDKLRAEVSIQQVLQLLGFEPNRCRGDQWYGRCPLPGCPPSQRSCFSANVWSAATGLPLYPAAIDLCVTLGRDVPRIQRW